MARSRTKNSSYQRIGWTGVPRKEREEKEWEKRFQELVAFKQQHGHTNVFRRGPLAQRQLATWVVEQRRRRRQGKMPPERYARLSKIGLDWDRRKTRPDEMWSVMYARMKAYKETYGDCLVPQRFEDDIKLGRWVSLQRMHRSKGRLSKTREEKLDKIGFVWDAEEYLPPNILRARRKARSAAGAARKRYKKSRSRESQEQLFSVGTLVMKYFDGDGWFLGEISSNAAGYRVVYEDGDREFYSLDSEQLREMVDNARDVTADEILLDPDADEDDETETEEGDYDSEMEEENDVEEEEEDDGAEEEEDDAEEEEDDAEEEEDDLFSNEPLEEEEDKEAVDELFATPDVEDEDLDEDSDEEYCSALEEAEQEEEEEDELFLESDHDEEEPDTKEEEKDEEQPPPQPAPKQSRFSLLQNRVYSFFASKTK